jgi:hypothetical protein
MSFSLDMQIETLALYCADFLIKCMMNKNEKLFYEESHNESKNNVLEIMYNLSRFDILQMKLERLKVDEIGGKSKDFGLLHDSDDKENYEAFTRN